MQQPRLLGSKPALLNDDAETTSQLVLGLVPLLFGYHDPQIGPSD